MDDAKMVPRVELERLLEITKRENETAVREAIESVENKVQVQLNVRNIAQAKIAVIKKAALETPEMSVKEVWDMAERARSPLAPTAATPSYSDDAAEMEGLYKRLEESEAAKERLEDAQTLMKEAIDAFDTRLEEEKAAIHANQQTRIDTIKRQAKDRDTERKDAIASLKLELQDARQSTTSDQNGPVTDVEGSTSVTEDPMDCSMATDVVVPASPEPELSSADRSIPRRARSGLNPISTTDMGRWTLSPIRARYLVQNNKTIDDLLKADIMSKVEQQTAPLKTLIVQKDEIISNLVSMRKIAESTTASIRSMVQETPDRPVEEAWETAVRERPLQLLHRTKPCSERICFTSDPTTLNVGSPATVFKVPQELLCQTSEFFKRALKAEWREGQTKCVDLAEDDADSFSVWLNWIYRHNLAIGLEPSESMRTEDGRSTESGTKMWSRLNAAYTLGDKLMDGDFKDAVVDAMAFSTLRRGPNKWWWTPCLAARVNLFRTTTPGSTARKLLIHLMAGARRLLSEEDDPSLLFEIAQLMFMTSSNMVLKAAAQCEFHEHGSMDCYRLKYSIESTLDG